MKKKIGFLIASYSLDNVVVLYVLHYTLPVKYIILSNIHIIF